MVAQSSVLWSPALLSWRMNQCENVGSRTHKCFFFFFFFSRRQRGRLFYIYQYNSTLSSPVEHDEKKRVDMKPHVVFEADRSICVFTKRPITITAQTPPHAPPNAHPAASTQQLHCPRKRWTLFPPYHPLKNLQKHRDPLSLIKKTTVINTGWEAGKQRRRGGERGVCSERALRSITEHACLSHIHCFGFFHRCGDAVHCKEVDLTPRSLTPLQVVQLSPTSSSLLTCRAQVDVLFILELSKIPPVNAKVCIGS